jgi:glycosyltransferase involved in cell wall biosynthesis
MRDSPLGVSVIVPVYNSHETLPLLLLGLQMQTYSSKLIELVVADDGSTEPYLDILGAKEYPWPIRYVSQPRLGYRVGSARNLGADAATNAVLIFLDADIVPTPQLIAAHARWHTDGAKAAVFGPRRFIRIPQGSVTDKYYYDTILGSSAVASRANFGRDRDRRWKELQRFKSHPFGYHLFHGCNASVRRQLWKEVGGYSSVYDGHWGYEDTDFAYRLWESGTTFVAEPDALALHLETDSLIDRSVDDNINFGIACRMIPEFKEFKDRLRLVDREPWW